ncbi:MAG TPA: hypothetical protein VMM35_04535 [Longimicrobiales bacterium]|nr:hypothetical protein [Longimicrobiales bacterium]
MLPDALLETSGAAVSGRDPGAVWTHNDDGSALYAIDERGRVLSEHRLPVELRDWEDLAIADCLSGSCLYLADTGDNAERRSGGDVRIVRVPEPDPRARTAEEPSALEADVFPIALPDGARDIEAIFVLPGERVHLITKGRQHALTVYRYPGPLRRDTVVLEEVQRLSDGPRSLLAQVTGASASADGSVVAVRTYQSLEFFQLHADTLARRPNGLVNLRTLEEIQGEAVALGPEGLVVLTSEGGPLGGPASMRLLTCRVEGG